MKRYFPLLLLIIIFSSCSNLSRKPTSIVEKSNFLTFKLDINYLALHSLKAITNWYGKETQEARKEVVRFQKRAWDLYQEDYEMLINFKWIYPWHIGNEQLALLENLSKKLIELPEFVPLHERTKKYFKELTKEWDRNFEISYSTMKKITNLEFKKPLTVFVTHPFINQGKALGDQSIAWGGSKLNRKQSFPNYSTVYLWHETLHYYISRKGPSHALIELITDNELRVKLNGGKYPPFMGHTDKDMTRLRKEINPRWQRYLNTESKDIKKLEKELLKSYENR